MSVERKLIKMPYYSPNFDNGKNIIGKGISRVAEWHTFQLRSTSEELCMDAERKPCTLVQAHVIAHT